MIVLKKWESLPKELQNESIRPYYEILKKRKVSFVLKRAIDIICSIVLIIILSPILIFFAIWIKLDSKGPVFYRQIRITTYGKKFKIFKFRSMVQNADKIGALVTSGNDSRITKVGSKMRKLRIDELPQIFNLFTGDLTLVGTRPEVEKYVNEYTDEMKATLLMPAGITSYASIKFKNEDEIITSKIKNGKDIDEIYIKDILPEKMKYNLEYMKKFNIWYDIKLCINTVLEVIK